MWTKPPTSNDVTLFDKSLHLKLTLHFKPTFHNFLPLGNYKWLNIDYGFCYESVNVLLNVRSLDKSFHLKLSASMKLNHIRQILIVLSVYCHITRQMQYEPIWWSVAQNVKLQIFYFFLHLVLPVIQVVCFGLWGRTVLAALNY